MIEPGDGWRFREHLLDLPLLQDQVVEHVLTGHQAMRRVFSDEVCRDEKALAEIKDQIAHAAGVRHPGLQRLYRLETINKRLALTMELIQGTTLKTLTLAHSFKQPARWAAHARLVVRLLRSLSRDGVAIDRVRLADLVFVGGALRLSSHQPVSPHAVEGDGAVLHALRQVPTGGVYVRGNVAPRAGEWNQLMRILYFMASGQRDRDIAAAEKFFGSQQHSHSKLGIELPIENLLLRFCDETNPETVWHWDDLLSAIELLVNRVDKDSPRQRINAPPPPHMPSSRQKVSESDASVGQVRFTLQEPEKPMAQPVIIAPKQAVTLQEMVEADARTAAVQPPPVPPHAATQTVPPEPPNEGTSRRTRDEVFTRDEMRMPGRLTIDEDAEEDRNYLYPPSSSTEAVKKSGSTAVKRRKSVSRRRMMLVGGGVAGIVLLGGVVFALVNVIGTATRSVNNPPTAAIAPIDQAYPATEPIPLDGTGSSDPDGDPLTYTWSIIDAPAGVNFRINPNNSRNSDRTTLRIDTPGEYTVQLEVFDMTQTSEPVTTTVRVSPPRLRAR